MNKTMPNNLFPYRFAYPNVTNFADHKAMYHAMREWIIENVDNFCYDAMWTKIGDCIYINIRDDQMAMLFVLKFGKGNEYESV